MCTLTYTRIFLKSSHNLIKLQNEIIIRVVLLVYIAIGIFHLSHCTIGELVDDAVFGTNDHLSIDYMMVTYMRYFCVEINISTVIVPPSTLPLSCTVTTGCIIIIIWSGKYHPIELMRCKPIDNIIITSAPTVSG